jgi:hypothetical protein
LAEATLPPVRRLSFFAFGRAGEDQRLAVQIVDHLHVDVIQRTVHVQPRALRGSLHLFADAVVHVSALLCFSMFA